MRTIAVEGEGFRSYDVLIGRGLLQQVGDRMRDLRGGGRVAVVTDTRVGPLYGADAVARLRAAGFETDLIAVPEGEASKGFAALELLCDRLLEAELDRTDLVVALGGGVVGDLAGFAAAILKRGVDFVQIPTTLLAQVDSSVGGKTAIDTPRGKNLIGAFWQPRLVLCDLDLLGSLDARQLRAGWAEVIKYGLLGDAGFFDWIEREQPAALRGGPGALERAVARSVEMKAQIVGEDAREAGRRALLNLGHTFGHALEAETGFGGALLHGEAVALGCALAFRFSAARGLCPVEAARRAESVISAAGLPVRLGEIGHSVSADRLIHHMRHDKKAEAGALVLVLARHIGDAFVARGVDPVALKDHLIQEGAAP